MHTRSRTGLLLLMMLLGLTACVAPSDDAPSPVPSVGRRDFELDDMGVPPAGMELFVLADAASVERVRETFERIHGSFVHHLPPRLVIGKVPAGADAVLAQAGVVQRFARAVSPSELGTHDAREARFVRVFSSRYYPAGTQPFDVVKPKRAVRSPDEPFEVSEDPAAPRFSTLKATVQSDSDAEQAERGVFVPYASGRIVVSIILPESNGQGEDNTENWSDDGIAEVYAKIQAATEVLARHEPNAQLSFVFHYESAPANGGLEGTVDVDWEYGKQAWGGLNLANTYAQIFSRILDKPVVEYEYWQAQADYLAELKERYHADGAYIVYVAANQNFTAGFRAYASINGPSTSLDSSYGFETFAHEFGHIFGALDEYCPDACIPPSSMHGYLGIVNANAQYRPGPWGGIRGGRGESQGSLMMYNVPNGVNGYTRGAWGWLDSDGDGIVEVRDTLPTADLRAEVQGSEVRLLGRIIDVPATPNWATPYSVNRIRALHVRKAGASQSVRIPVFSDRRGREDVDMALGPLASGHYELELRGENSVGNLQPTATRVAFDVTGEVRNAAPIVSLSADIDVLSPNAAAGVTASVLDLDGDSVQVRFDVDGDGRYDTAFSRATTTWVTPRNAGLTMVGVEARDARGASALAQMPLYVLEGNAPARPGLPDAPSPMFGSPRARFAAVGEVNDPERASTKLNYKLERDDYLRSMLRESGFDVPRAQVFDVETQGSLVATPVDLSALDTSLDRWTYVYDAVRLAPAYVALALGDLGVAVIDLVNPQAPRFIARLTLQTAAYDLSLAANGALFVWGDKLTVVDLKNPEQPVEVLQYKVTKNTRVLENRQPTPFDEQFSRGISMWSSFYETIEHASVSVELEHPAWEELRITLLTPAGDSILLWDHGQRSQGQSAISLDDRHSSGLVLMLGDRASGDYRIEVLDDVLNGNAGTILSASITLETTHRGFQPDLAFTNTLVGSTGSTLVLAGAGLETVDFAKLDKLRGLDVLVTEGIQKAQVVGQTVIGVTGPQEPAGDGRARGLFGVDLSRPDKLRLLRNDPAVNGDAGFALAGSRFYVSSWRDSTTRVGSTSAFLSGASFWLGQSALVLGSDLTGDDSSLWVAHGPVERLDVRNPSAMTVLERFEDPYAWSTRFFDARTAFVLGSAGELWQLDLQGRVNQLSEVYRLTAQACDSADCRDPRLLSEVSRTVHVVPYDHAPWISSASFVRASTTRDSYDLEVRVTDPDDHPAWDQYLAVRVDWEGDGIYDGPWMGLWDVATLSHMYDQAGDYQVRIQARDGYHALSDQVVVPVHVEAYVPVVCTSSADCPSGDYCEQGANGCGAEGLCQRVSQGCFGFVYPVCGCDGSTHRNVCEAQEAGTSVASYGVCESEVMRCGGPAGVSCSVAGMFCRYGAGETREQSCGAGQAHGDCVYPPNQCFGAVDAGRVGFSSQPVCGCDGNTYWSACAADSASVSVAYFGECGAPVQ